MSSIDSLKLELPVAGGTTYTSPITDLLRYNSISYSAFYTHASLLLCDINVFFSNSVDDEDFKLYSTISLLNEVRSTGNLLIPSRYFKFSVQNTAADAMENIDVVFTAHKTATSNIDVNIGSDDITISGVATEVTQLQVKSVLDNIDTGINKVISTAPIYINEPSVAAGTTTSTIDLGTGKDRYNTIQVIGSSTTNGFNFRLDYSVDDVDWYADGVFSAPYNSSGSVYEFAVSRFNISTRYVRVHIGSTTGSNVYMYYSLSKE